MVALFVVVHDVAIVVVIIAPPQTGGSSKTSTGTAVVLVVIPGSHSHGPVGGTEPRKWWLLPLGDLEARAEPDPVQGGRVDGTSLEGGARAGYGPRPHRPRGGRGHVSVLAAVVNVVVVVATFRFVGGLTPSDGVIMTMTRTKINRLAMFDVHLHHRQVIFLA